MLRILHIVSGTGISSGVMNFIMNYYRHIDRTKVQFDFLCWIINENNYDDEIKLLGGQITYIEKPVPNLRGMKSLNVFFSENANQYEIVHLHEVYLNYIVKFFCGKNKIENIISHSHTTKYSDKKINALRNMLLCVNIKKNVNHYFACSYEAGKFLYGEKLMIKNKVSIIKNAVNIDNFLFRNDLRKKYRDEYQLTDKFVIGHVGRFNHQKNHVFLIDIFYETLKINDNSVLVLIGKGPLETEVKNKVRILGIEDKVIFIGETENVNELMQMMDYFVLPSLFEGLGIVLVEAQLSGLRCIVSSAVPEEVCITDNVKYLGLNNSSRVWAEQIISSTNERQKYSNKDFKDSGYDIRYEASKLQQLYSSISNKSDSR